jgi:S-adenosyl-L-methionine hydrolase (adenosine-forming)
MLITLTTDFGWGSTYVAAVKGVLLGMNPALRLVDLTHAIAPQDLKHAAVFLAETIPWFPAGTIHLIVVDPGVGTERNLLYIEAGGHRLLAPDNGCWLPAATRLGGPLSVRRLADNRYWRNPVSSTFHGRDILAPVAAHLSLGLSPDALGPQVQTWVALHLPEPVIRDGHLEGEVLFVDAFGNLLTNIPGTDLALMANHSAQVEIQFNELDERAAVVKTYSEAQPGALVALASSWGTLEIAVAHGSAARRLGIGPGARIIISLCQDGGD